LPETLPSTLEQLHCGTNKLTALPKALPDTLTDLYCYDNKLTALPEKLPPNLKSLLCDTNCLTILPDLPATLTAFDCTFNPGLTKNYPELNKCNAVRERIAYVNRRNREMREAHVEEIRLNSKGLTELPPLPPNLKKLWCNNNSLTKLPETLPATLQELYCYRNKLTALPAKLPDTLVSLLCPTNELTSLPKVLPDTLINLHCNDNKLTTLPSRLPPKLGILYIYNNCLTVLPDLPETLTGFECTANPGLTINYPELYNYKNVCERVAYVNRRNREMSYEIVTEAWLSHVSSGQIKPITCIIKKTM
jgi:Leucine-rich repeat (LRR) protein